MRFASGRRAFDSCSSPAPRMYVSRSAAAASTPGRRYLSPDDARRSPSGTTIRLHPRDLALDLLFPRDDDLDRPPDRDGPPPGTGTDLPRGTDAPPGSLPGSSSRVARASGSGLARADLRGDGRVAVLVSEPLEVAEPLGRGPRVAAHDPTNDHGGARRALVELGDAKRVLRNSRDAAFDAADRRRRATRGRASSGASGAPEKNTRSDARSKRRSKRSACFVRRRVRRPAAARRRRDARADPVGARAAPPRRCRGRARPRRRSWRLRRRRRLRGVHRGREGGGGRAGGAAYRAPAGQRPAAGRRRGRRGGVEGGGDAGEPRGEGGGGRPRTRGGTRRRRRSGARPGLQRERGVGVAERAEGEDGARATRDPVQRARRAPARRGRASARSRAREERVCGRARRNRRRAGRRRVVANTSQAPSRAPPVCAHPPARADAEHKIPPMNGSDERAATTRPAPRRGRPRERAFNSSSINSSRSSQDW